MDEIQTLKNIAYTLDKVEVHGKQNMDALLGCINALENLIPVLQEALNRLDQAEANLAEAVNVPADSPEEAGANDD